jgi:hypothetical protein
MRPATRELEGVDVVVGVPFDSGAILVAARAWDHVGSAVVLDHMGLQPGSTRGAGCASVVDYGDVARIR